MSGTPTAFVDEALFRYGTDRQVEYLKAINEHGSQRAAATACGVAYQVVNQAYTSVKNKAARYGYAPEHDMTSPVPDGFKIARHSQYYDATGAPRNKWVIATPDAQRQEAMRAAALEALSAELPRLYPIAAPKGTSAELCNLYTFTDCHVGMLAWHKEGGADWDIKIAEKTLVGCFEQMILASPEAEVGIVNQCGDFLHYDSLTAVTPSHGHILDADTRYSNMVGAAIRILRRIIDLALMRHARVRVNLAEGNHDMASSVWLRHMFAALYENDPRVTVDTSELPFYVYQHGKVMLAFHHGHMVKNEQLPLLFASQYPAIWGGTSKRYAHTGHRHHKDEKEHAGMTVVQHPTLAARDAYAARGGWISEREATAMTYHSEFGLVARNTVTPEMLAA